MAARQKTRGKVVAPPPPAPARPALVALICLALTAITIAAYTPVWQFDFIALDDPGYVTENPDVTGGLSAASVKWALTTGHEANWHPLTWVSHMVDVELFGLNAGAHHVVNLVLHILSALLLFLVLRALTDALWPSAFVAAIFAVHPLHVESVAWVAERKDVLSGLFFMLTLGAYVKYRHAPTRWRYALVALMLALGLMAKPMLVTAPFVLLIIDWWRGADRMRPMVMEKIPLFVIAAVFSVITFIAQSRFGATKSLAAYPLPLRIQNACVSYLEYLKDAVWPSGLSTFYPFPSALAVDTVLISAIILLGITLAVMAYARRDRVWAAGWFWFAGMLVPVIGLAQAGNQARADRFMYLPLIGLTIAVAWGIGARLRGAIAQRAAGVAALGAVAACAAVAHATVQPWRDTETLWAYTARVSEGSQNFGVYFALAQYLQAHNRREDAVAWYQGAVQRNPNYAEAQRALGLLLSDLGRLPEAIDHLSEAARLKPDDAEVQWQLGLALATTGRVIDALPALAQAARLSPASPMIHNDYGWALVQHGQPAAGIRELREAVRLDPDFFEARLNTARALASLGQIDAAAAEARELLRRSPGHPGAQTLLAALGRK